MQNPLDTIRKWQAKLGKPIRPIVEFQKGTSVCSIVTNSIQTENMIQDQYQNKAWEVHPNDQSVALYIDGVFRGIGHYAGEEGQILNLKKEVSLFREDLDEDGTRLSSNWIPVLCASYSGLHSKLLDASLLERASALKPSLMEKLIFCGVGVLIGIMVGMSYAK
jgi:hypothetical protein